MLSIDCSIAGQFDLFSSDIQRPKKGGDFVTQKSRTNLQGKYRPAPMAPHRRPGRLSTSGDGCPRLWGRRRGANERSPSRVVAAIGAGGEAHTKKINKQIKTPAKCKTRPLCPLQALYHSPHLSQRAGGARSCAESPLLRPIKRLTFRDESSDAERR